LIGMALAVYDAMDQKIKNSLLFMLVSAMVVLAVHGVSNASAPADAEQGPATGITSISERRSDGADVLMIKADGRFPREHTAWINAVPPKIIIDISLQVPPFESTVQAVSFPGVRTVRVGHHPKTIRLVLDLEGPDIPMFSSAVEGSVLVISLQTDSDDTVETILPFQKSRLVTDPTENRGSLQRGAHLYDAQAQLIRLEGMNAPSVYRNSVAAYTAENWSTAVNYLDEFIETSPESLFTEKAYFLAAKAYDRLHADNSDRHYNAVKQRYEDGIYRYPESAYVPDAYFAIADLSFRVGVAPQSMGYCNLVINLGKQDHATLKAKILKAKLLSAANKTEEALAMYQTIQRQYPDLAEGVQVKIETAETLFKMNRFQQSLGILKTLAQKSENVSRYPQLSRILGNNYYQLGDFTRAREHLFRYYNTSPDAQDGHLILARIADAYREEGQAAAATKFYRLAVERHPDTEGAMISMYRMAEQQENGEIEADKNTGTGMGIKVIDSRVGMPREIYAKVVQGALAKDETSPLVQYALLKLAIIDLKDKQYGRSLDRLKHLMEQYPQTRLKKEINRAFEEALLSILEADFKVKKYKRIVNTYQAEKKILAQCTAPRLFLIIARSAMHLELDDLAGEMFKRADLYLPDQKKPADLLFHLAETLDEQGEPRGALAYIDLFIANFPEDKTIADGYVLKGNILSHLNEHAQAANMFSSALDHTYGACARPGILIQKAKALSASGVQEPGYQTLLAADKAAKGCGSVGGDTLAEIGELYLQSGYPEKALAAIQSDRTAGGQGIHASRLQLVMARCYEELNNKDSYVSIYNEVANQDDRFWGKVAREKMDEISFNAVMQKGM